MKGLAAGGTVLMLGALVLMVSCSGSGPAGPPESRHGAIPWGGPPSSEGQGRFGGALDRR